MENHLHGLRESNSHAEKKRILVLATGGTIASRSGSDGLVPDIPLEQLLNYVPGIRGQCSLEAVQIMNLDSTNMQPSGWLTIAGTIRQRYEEFDGFVILHGTDTMAYTAAALSYLIQNSPKPVVLTGAQKPIDQDISDAKSNVIQSVLYACDDRASDVNFVFNGEVIAGTRGRKVRTKSFNAFSSVDFPHKAVIRENQVIHYIDSRLSGRVRFYDRLDEKVFVLRLIPGLRADILRYLGEYFHAVVIEGFGIGGIPNTEEMRFLPLIRELLDKGVTVVATTQVPLEGSDLDVYEVGRLFKRDERLLEAYNMTLEAIVTKLMWILGQTREHAQIRELFYRQINYDLYQ